MNESVAVRWLRNRYWVLRHGRSLSNVKGINVCSMENGILEEYKLAPQGVDQATLAGESFKKLLLENGIPFKKVRICYSPFSRTIQTAKIVASILHLPFEEPQCQVMNELRERYFGASYELKSNKKNVEVGELDKKDPCAQPDGGGESVSDVASRLTKALLNMESEFEGCAVLIVSHGDPLQILQAMLEAAAVAETHEHAGLASRMEAITVSSVLSKHRNFALLTGQLRSAPSCMY